jgi:DNA mismatch repair protein MSH6
VTVLSFCCSETTNQLFIYLLSVSDELGRGTSTFDGTAIAGATVKHLIERSQCISLFATHYHSLLDEWKDEPKVRLGHMQCIVEDNDEETASDTADSSITFLYSLGPGTCPKSFGINVARLASLPEEVLTNAKRASEEFEKGLSSSNPQADDESSNAKQQIREAIEAGDWDGLEKIWQSLNQ